MAYIGYVNLKVTCKALAKFSHFEVADYKHCKKLLISTENQVSLFMLPCVAYQSNRNSKQAKRPSHIKLYKK